MNYVAHYDRLIDRARCRILTGYKERHHVVPRCMGGTDAPENLVDLTAEEHYVAHQLLVRMHPRNGRLAHAAVLMSRRATGNKSFGWLRKKIAIFNSEAKRGNKNWVGKKHSAETIAKMSAAKKGVKKSAQQCAAMSAALAGKPLPAHVTAKAVAVNTGCKRSAETRLKMSIALKGKKRSLEQRARISAARLGKKNGPFSPEHRAKIAAALRGRSKPQSVRDKISATKRAMAAIRMSMSTKNADLVCEGAA